MKKHRSIIFYRRCFYILIFLGIALCAGCLRSKQFKGVHATTQTTENHYSLFDRLPSRIKRVAVFPVTAEPDDWLAVNAKRDLQPVLISELGKLNRFELRLIMENELSEFTGSPTWQSQDSIPENLLLNMQNAFGTDAILISHIFVYHPYRPIVIGWKIKLIDVRLASILWAADELFDAGDSDTLIAAERYFSKQASGIKNLNDLNGRLLSPMKFSQFTLQAILDSIPTPPSE